MKTNLFPALLMLAALAAPVRAEEIRNTPPPAPVYVPPPVYQAPAAPAPQQAYVYDQKPLPGMPALVTPEQAQSIVDQFKAALPKLGGSRILVYVNRDLVDQKSGLKLAGRTEQVETTRTTANSSTAATNQPETRESTTTHSVANNNYYNNGKSEPTLADRQTTRDVERLVGRPLRGGGASIVDQPLASQLIEGRPIESLGTETEQARKDREAVGKIADVVIEILMSSRNVVVPEISGDITYSVPDLQMTAIRLQDAKVIGQASASDVMNRRGGAGYATRTFGVEAITEATALALMENMTQDTK